MHNLLETVPESLPAELLERLAGNGQIRIERIISHGHSSPEGFWYDQEWHEWVVLLRGAARLRFEGDPEPIAMRPGDFLTIPAHIRHRVEWTTPEEPTIWLAVHCESEIR